MAGTEKTYAWDFQPRPLVHPPAVKADHAFDAIELCNSPRSISPTEPYKATLLHQRAHCPANARFAPQVANRPQHGPEPDFAQNLS
jgi:hypothetical protein